MNTFNKPSEQQVEDFVKLYYQYSHLSNDIELIKNYICKKWDEYSKSSQTLAQFVKQWRTARGATEEFRIPEDIALRFFENHEVQSTIK